MVLRDIYNVVGEATQETFFSEDYSTYEVINANTEAHYRYTGHNDDICLGGDRSEIFDKEWVLGLPVVGITARNHRVIIWVDGGTIHL